jgi:hypothetical protein
MLNTTWQRYRALAPCSPSQLHSNASTVGIKRPTGVLAIFPQGGGVLRLIETPSLAERVDGDAPPMTALHGLIDDAGQDAPCQRTSPDGRTKRASVQSLHRQPMETRRWTTRLRRWPSP